MNSAHSLRQRCRDILAFKLWNGFRECPLRSGRYTKRPPGYPVDFGADGTPIYEPSNDANVFFGPLTDNVRDYKVRRIAESVYEILENLGYERLGGA